MIIKNKDLLGLKNLSADEINLILQSAESMKYILCQPMKKAPHLVGKSVVELFFEDSIRTKFSFELAAKYMQGMLSTVNYKDYIDKGEKLIDIAKAVEQMGADFIIVRHKLSGAAELIARNVSTCVINAGDGNNEHPTQALVDIFTVKQAKGKIEGLKVAIIGDIIHSREAKSNIWGFLKLGAKVCVGAPATLIPPELSKMGVEVYNNVQEALIDADVVMTLKLDKKGQESMLFPDKREFTRFYGLDLKRLGYAKPDAIVLNPANVRRGVELTSDVIDNNHCKIADEIQNGVAVKMAVLKLFAGRNGKNEYSIFN